MQNNKFEINLIGKILILKPLIFKVKWFLAKYWCDGVRWEIRSSSRIVKDWVGGRIWWVDGGRDWVVVLGVGYYKERMERVEWVSDARTGRSSSCAESSVLKVGVSCSLCQGWKDAEYQSFLGYQSSWLGSKNRRPSRHWPGQSGHEKILEPRDMVSLTVTGFTSHFFSAFIFPASLHYCTALFSLQNSEKKTRSFSSHTHVHIHR